MKLTAFLLIISLPAGLFAQQGWRINIEAGKYTRNGSPIEITLPRAIPPGSSLELFDPVTKEIIPAQIRDSTHLIFILNKFIPVGTSYSFILRKSNTSHPIHPVTIIKSDSGLLVKVKSKPLLFYHTKEVMPPPDSPIYYRRSGFIHPLYSPDGAILTDEFPAGHIHQHAIFMAWVNTTFKKEMVDFWNQHLQKGTVEHVEILDIKEGPVFAEMKLKLRHRSIQFGEVLSETWTIIVYPFTDYFLFDLESEQLNTTTDTLFINQYHYGGLAFRGSREWNPDDKKNYKGNWHLLTSEGIEDTLANHTHARWVDVWGPMGDLTGGVTVFSAPTNFRYPQGLRVHPAMPYWAFAPMIDGPFNIPPASVYRSRYRYYVHRGSANKTINEAIHLDWAEPPTVKVIMNP